MTSALRTGILIIIGVALVGLLYWWLARPAQNQRYDGRGNTPNAVLQRENAPYAEALALFAAREYGSARQKFAEALERAGDPIEEGQILYKIALTDEMLGDYPRAIQEFKQIAANGALSTFVRAYAIQRIGFMYYVYGYTHPEIARESFKGDPYASFLENGDYQLAYRRLFEYASSIYPLGIAESRIASWYATDAARLYKAGEKYEARRAADIAREHIARADADIERVKNDPNASPDIPGILMRKGYALGALARIGMAEAQEAEAAFKTALALSALGQPDGYARYNYASFLEEQYGAARAQDIAALLAPLYTGTRYSSDPVMPFLTSQRNVKTPMHRSLVHMAKMDVKFAELLKRLGWTDADLRG